MAKGKKTGGRQKGTQNKTTSVLKEAVILAAANSHKDGVVGYLTVQAQANPVAFMSLMGRVIPLQHEGPDGGPIRHVHSIERRIVRPRD